jgi:glycosyltransferase involved in cell wall biosynthesis
MPILNAEKFLPETLRSLKANWLEGNELLVVDDGCTDRSMELVADSGLPGRTLQGEGGGPAAARNLALKQACGRYVAFLDADDLWPPDTLRLLLDTLREGDGSEKIAQGRVETFADGPVADTLKARLKPVPAYAVNLGSALFRKNDLDQLGGFDESLRFDEDTDLWLRCWEAGLSKKLLPEVTLHYRLHQENMTRGAQSNSRALLPLLKRHRDRMKGRQPLCSQGLAEYLGWTS